MRQVLDDFLKRLVEAFEVVREERAAAADVGESLEDLCSGRPLGRPPLADDVDGGVAAFDAPLGRRLRRMTRLVLAVAEDDDRAPAGLAAHRLDRLDDGVVERGPSPGVEPVDDVRARFAESIDRRDEREHVLVEREERDRRLRRHAA